MNFGKVFGKIDPVSMALAIGSLFGGDDSGQKRQSFAGTGPTDPINSLYQALNATTNLGRHLQSRGPVKLRSSAVQRGPEPVSIPGLPFQIGGGLGTDPALMDPSLLQGTQQPMTDVFSPLGPQTYTSKLKKGGAKRSGGGSGGGGNFFADLMSRLGGGLIPPKKTDSENTNVGA